MRRLFNGELTESDLFLDLSFEQQCLYFHSCLYADDEGFIKNPKSICRTIGVDYKECEELINKGFYIAFTSGVIVVTHWFLHNKIRKDRMKATVFLDEKNYLFKSENGVYNVVKYDDVNQVSTECQPSVRPIYNINSIYNIINNNIINTNIVSSELSNSSEQEECEPYIIELPLNDGTMYKVTASDYDKYITLYPSIDIMQELRNMRGWLDANPKKQKTNKGIGRFINGWLQRSQDRGNMLSESRKSNTSKRSYISEWGET